MNARTFHPDRLQGARAGFKAAYDFCADLTRGAEPDDLQAAVALIADSIPATGVVRFTAEQVGAWLLIVDEYDAYVAIFECDDADYAAEAVAIGDARSLLTEPYADDTKAYVR